MSTRVDEARTGHRARRHLGAPCGSCGSTDTWVELHREDDRTRPGGVGEWPYAVCGACGHAVRGRRKPPSEASPAAAATQRVSDTASSGESAAGRDGAASDRQAADGQNPRRGGPPRPKASDGRVEELLRAAGYSRAITAEVLEDHRRFATHAGKPGLPRWKAAVALLNGTQGRDDVPHVREIYAEEKRRREVKRARAARLREQAGALADEHVVAAREHVGRVRAETGEGPTWRELASALGVKGPLASAMVDALHRRGALTSTKEPRSLAATPDWTSPSS